MSARPRASKMSMPFPATLITWGSIRKYQVAWPTTGGGTMDLARQLLCDEPIAGDKKQLPEYGAQGTVKDAQDMYAKAHDRCLLKEPEQ